MTGGRTVVARISGVAVWTSVAWFTARTVAALATGGVADAGPAAFSLAVAVCVLLLKGRRGGRSRVVA